MKKGVVKAQIYLVGWGSSGHYAASDEYDALKHLQYEFMENHEKLSDGIYRATYSDGTAITVDYNKVEYAVSKHSV